MRSVVFCNRFYVPDVAATGQMLADLAEDLARDGWDTTVVTGRGRYAAAGGAAAGHEVLRGVRVRRVRTTTFGQATLAGRVAGYASYLVAAFGELLRVPRGTIVVAMTDPPLLVVPVLLAARVRGLPVVAWVQDVYPHLAVALGALAPDTLTARLLHHVARVAHRACAAVVTLSPAMSRVVTDMGVRPERVAEVPNWIDVAAVRPIDPAENPFRRAHELTGRFVVLYSGTAGRAHTFDAVLGAAHALRGDPDVVFVFVGGGTRIPALREAVARAGLDASVRFLPYQPREALAASLASGDVALVTETPEAAGLVLPSKVYAAMASGRPIVYVGPEDSDVAQMMRTLACGIVVRHDDASGVAHAIERLKGDPALRARLGGAGRSAARALYDRRHATRRFGAVLTALASGVPVDGVGDALATVP